MQDIGKIFFCFLQDNLHSVFNDKLHVQWSELRKYTNTYFTASVRTRSLCLIDKKLILDAYLYICRYGRYINSPEAAWVCLQVTTFNSLQLFIDEIRRRSRMISYPAISTTSPLAACTQWTVISLAVHVYFTPTVSPLLPLSSPMGAWPGRCWEITESSDTRGPHS
jgi:hypothetical protein